MCSRSSCTTFSATSLARLFSTPFARDSINRVRPPRPPHPPGGQSSRPFLPLALYGRCHAPPLFSETQCPPRQLRPSLALVQLKKRWGPGIPHEVFPAEVQLGWNVEFPNRDGLFGMAGRRSPGVRMMLFYSASVLYDT